MSPFRDERQLTKLYVLNRGRLKVRDTTLMFLLCSDESSLSDTFTKTSLLVFTLGIERDIFVVKMTENGRLDINFGNL